VEAVKYFLLSLPASLLPLPASFFKVLPLPQKFNRFQLPLPHPCPMFMKNAFASGFSKNQMLPSLLPLPASFFKVLPLSQKINRFHSFQLPVPHPGCPQTPDEILHTVKKVEVVTSLFGVFANNAPNKLGMVE